MASRASNVDVTSTHVDPNEVVRTFAANPAFRAATAEELVNEHNPFRRPVRPDDLAWLDFSVPLVPAKALMLSALLGHRMLRNIYGNTGKQYFLSDENKGPFLRCPFQHRRSPIAATEQSSSFQ